MQIVGCCFLLLATYVCYEAIHALVARQSPDRSTVGIALAALSLVVMPTLARFKRRIASKLTSGALEAEARQTEVRLALGRPSRRPRAQRVAWLVVGGPGCRSGHDPPLAWEGWQAVRGRTCCAD